MSILDLKEVTVEYKTPDGPLRATDKVNLSLEEGSTLGLVGESGCGKTTLGKSILQILPSNGQIVDGEVIFDGHDLTEFKQKELNKQIRWTRIAWIAQNAMNALNPVQKIGSQIVEVIRVHEDCAKAEARDRAINLLEDVGLESERRRDYPHELSGGQRQRVVIALALALDPDIVIADEPTTGLDVVVQDAILRLIKELQEERRNSMIFISHDISAVAEVADEVAVMYGGQVVESGTTREVFKKSAHPYTIGLRNAFPSLRSDSDTMISIPGVPPNLVDPPNGCLFSERCPFVTEECEEEPLMNVVDEGHMIRCHYPEDASSFRQRGSRTETWGK
jgi:peptide/nickel transport system ATP-binding protein